MHLSFHSIQSCEALESRRLLAAGDLDSSFGSAGTVSLNLSHGGREVRPFQLETVSGGKFLVAGTTDTGTLVLSRRLGNGRPDLTFGTGGVQVREGTPASLWSLIRGRNDRLYVVDGPLIRRLRTSGSFDTNFGVNGRVQLVNALAEVGGIDSEGRFVARQGTAVRRYLPDGSRDFTFARRGRIETADFDLVESLTDDFFRLAGVASLGQDRVLLYGNRYDGLHGASWYVFSNNGKTLDFLGDGSDESAFVSADVLRSGFGIIGVMSESGSIYQRAADYDDNGILPAAPPLFNDFARSGFFDSVAPGAVVESASGQVYSIKTYSREEPRSIVIQRYHPADAVDLAFGRGGVAVLSSEPMGSIPRSATVVGERLVVLAQRPDASSHTPTFVLSGVQTTPPQPPPVQLGGDGVLRVRGSAFADRVIVQVENERIHTNLYDRDYSFPAAGVRMLRFDTDAGDDVIDARHLPAGIKVLIAAGEGDDTLISGQGGGTLLGSGGNDVLAGGGSSDHFVGGAGTDTVSYGGLEEVLLDSSVYLEALAGTTRDIMLSLDNRANDGAAGERDNVGGDIEVIISGRGDDRIVANPLNNTIYGGGGRDTVFGGAGNDVIYLGYESAAFGAFADGQHGDDTIYGSGTLLGGAGHDRIFAFTGGSQIRGGDGDDVLGAEGDGGMIDTLVGGRGRDTAAADESDLVFEVEARETMIERW